MRLLFGEANPAAGPIQHDGHALIGMGWLYALHARAAIARKRLLQAEMMLAELRSQVLALACIRLGLNPVHGREAHHLPAELTGALIASHPARLRTEDLSRSLCATVEVYLDEVSQHNPRLAESLRPALRSLTNSVQRDLDEQPHVPHVSDTQK
jgi:hypothetical protein